MSKIGNLNLELQDQANELGYSTVQEAIDDGYTITYTDQKLVKDMSKEYEKAHKAWVEEKEKVIKELTAVADSLPAESGAQKAIEYAIDFIQKGEV